MNHTLIHTKVNLRFKLKHKITGSCFIENTRTKCPKTVKIAVKFTAKITVKITHDVGTVLMVTKHIFVSISQQCILQCNSVHIPQ